MIEKTFGRLRVLSKEDWRAGPHIVWKCICECGNTVSVRGYSLRHGHTKSCGCLKVDACKKRACPEREIAKKAGLKRYHGRPCRVCSGTSRVVSNGNCVSCLSKREKENRKKQSDEQRQRRTAIRTRWKMRNCGRDTEATRKRRATSPEKYRVYQRAYSNIRRANKLRAIPRWADLDAIKVIYEKCPPGHHVDHIIPLKGRVVCGLHVAENLQYLTASENCRKSNKVLL